MIFAPAECGKIKRARILRAKNIIVIQNLNFSFEGKILIFEKMVTVVYFVSWGTHLEFPKVTFYNGNQ